MRQVGENRRRFETPMAGDSTDRNSCLLDSCDYPAASTERVYSWHDIIHTFVALWLEGKEKRKSARAFHVLTLLRPPVSFHLQTPTTQATLKIELDQGHTLFLML